MDKYTTIRILRPEGYEDVHDDIVLDDFMKNPGAWTVEIISTATEHVSQAEKDANGLVVQEAIKSLRETTDAFVKVREKMKSDGEDAKNE